MYNVYIDEKGPQESFRISEPFDFENKLKYADDKMHSYVVNVCSIPSSNMLKVEEAYIEIENKYLATRPKLEPYELKGKTILKGNFKFGVASMKGNELDFYNSLFTMLKKYHVQNLFCSISKMSIIVSARLSDWILELDSKRFIDSATRLQYTFAKYANIEANENVIKKLLNKFEGTKDLLNAIKSHMQEIVDKNVNNKRMQSQISEYKYIIQLIKKYNYISNNPSDNYGFDWRKVTYAIDLWQTEQKVKSEDKIKYNLFLDEGIKKEYFEDLNFDLIEEECDSSKYVGIRIADVVVVLIGNLLNKLRISVTYDNSVPDILKRAPAECYQLNAKQFILMKTMYEFVYNDNTQYGLINDTYFDESVNIESFILYINSYKDFKEYNDFKGDHSDEHFRIYQKLAHTKVIEGYRSDKIIRNSFGKYKKAIEEKMVRPL